MQEPVSQFLSQQKDTASQCLPVRLLGLGLKILCSSQEFLQGWLQGAPSPHPPRPQRAARILPGRLGWIGFRSLITTRKLKKDLQFSKSGYHLSAIKCWPRIIILNKLPVMLVLPDCKPHFEAKPWIAECSGNVFLLYLKPPAFAILWVEFILLGLVRPC